jgi:hypothetical protein
VASILENHFLAGPGFWDLEKNQANRATYYLSINTKIALGTLVRFWSWLRRESGREFYYENLNQSPWIGMTLVQDEGGLWSLQREWPQMTIEHRNHNAGVLGSGALEMWV